MVTEELGKGQGRILNGVRILVSKIKKHWLELRSY